MADIAFDNPEIANMCLEKNRLASFKNWPFQDEGRTDICTAEKMAQAGFYSCFTDASPDSARCYVCFKELEGWEPNDNPWEEHRKHSPKCSFAKKGKPQAKLTVEEFCKMELESQHNRIEKIMGEKLEEAEKLAADVLEELRKLSST